MKSLIFLLVFSLSGQVLTAQKKYVDNLYQVKEVQIVVGKDQKIDLGFTGVQSRQIS